MHMSTSSCCASVHRLRSKWPSQAEGEPPSRSAVATNVNVAAFGQPHTLSVIAVISGKERERQRDGEKKEGGRASEREERERELERDGR